jgi:hypothetical protein
MSSHDPRRNSSLLRPVNGQRERMNKYVSRGAHRYASSKRTITSILRQIMLIIHTFQGSKVFLERRLLPRPGDRCGWSLSTQRPGDSDVVGPHSLWTINATNSATRWVLARLLRLICRRIEVRTSCSTHRESHRKGIPASVRHVRLPHMMHCNCAPPGHTARRCRANTQNVPRRFILRQYQ